MAGKNLTNRQKAERAKELLELFDTEVTPDSPAMRDPGLYPRFKLFVANLLTGYLRYAPQRINALVSAYDQIHNAEASQRNKSTQMADLVWARELYVDSGGITPLLGCLKGTAKPADVWKWVKNTDRIVAYAWELHEFGCPPGMVSMLDLPAYASALEAANITVKEAGDVTMANAEVMMKAELPPRWRKVFISQGVTLADHAACQDAYAALGIFDAVRSGDAVMAVGGMAFEKETARIHAVHKALRARLGEGHVHALGVSRLPALVPMIHHGWVDSADSSSPAQEVRYNRGPYQVSGPRPTFLWEAMHAASALYFEATLADALRRAEAHGLHEQVELFHPDEGVTPVGPATAAHNGPQAAGTPAGATNTPFEVVEPVAAGKGRRVCERCGEVDPDRFHEHPPFVAPDQADALYAAGVWERPGGEG